MLTKDTLNKIEAFEIWLHRRLLKISWTSRIRNSEVLKQTRIQERIIRPNSKMKTIISGTYND